MLVLGGFVLIGHMYDRLSIAYTFLGLYENQQRFFNNPSSYDSPHWFEFCLCVREDGTTQVCQQYNYSDTGKAASELADSNTTQRYLSAVLMPL